MCLAIPGLITSIEGKNAKVDFGGGTQRDIDVSLVDVTVGQYVLVHTGFAIEVLDREDALETIRVWKEILSQNTEP